MDHPDLSIRSMQAADLHRVVAIHRDRFPHSRSTSLGGPFVRKMYRWFLENHPDLALVAFVDDQPVGFVVGAIGGYGRMLFRYALVEIALGLLLHPGLLLRRSTFTLWHSLLKGLLPKRKVNQRVAPGPRKIVLASIGSIAVARNAQGMGVGKALVAAFENQARRLGATNLALSVENDNLAARRLYESCGWQMLNEDAHMGSVSYCKKTLPQ